MMGAFVGAVNDAGQAPVATPARLRDEVIAHLAHNSGSIPNEIAEKLLSGALRLSDAVMYACKPLSGNIIKMFVTKDDKTVGRSNLDKGKLEDGQVFVMSAIRFMVGVDTVGAGEPADVAFFEVNSDPKFANIENGEFKIVVDRKVIAEKMPMTVCATAGSKSQKGVYVFDNKRFLEPNKEIELTVEMGSTATLPANAWIRAEMIGALTLPA